ncbi:Six-hairpin glycosidase-like protein [Chytridium lagenaria]|nr:Six-hairpin glycosidase-like protein [Chytridium lagenaria]
MRGSFLLAAFTALLAVVTASPVNLERRAPVAVTPNPVPASGEVVLQTYSFDSDNNQFTGSIWVKNLAFNKVVQVFYSTPTVQWSPSQFVNAAYSRSAANGYEVWSFNAAPASLGAGSQQELLDPGWNSSPPSSSSSSPAPSGKPVVIVVSPNPPSNGAPVQVQQYTLVGGTLSGGLWIKNIAFNKIVNVIASTPSGSFVNAPTASASYFSTAANGYELWTFSGGVPNVDNGSQFYVKYETGTQTFYDNNNSKNYVISGASVSPAAAGGFGPDITNWLNTAVPFIKQYLFNAISPAETITGDYFFHWIRDASLVMDLVNELYIKGDNSLESKMWDFQSVTKVNQGKDFAKGGFGEPKYYVDGNPFDKDWCRPQNDGPALRASVFIRFAKAYLAKGGSQTRVRELYTSVIKPDLEYITRTLSETENCDLWEEKRGFHFFTQMVQRKALREGRDMANFLQDTGAGNFYGQIVSLLNRNVTHGKIEGRILDAAIPLTAIHGYDNDNVYSPGSDKILQTLYQLALLFSREYDLNKKPLQDNDGFPLSIAIGRYSGDTYNGADTDAQGNPWYLTTNSAGQIVVTPLSRPFIMGDRPSGLQAGNIAPGTYAKGSAEFNAIIGGLQSVGDSYIRRSKTHGDINFRFGEQFLRSDGTPNGKGVRDLTWSYASFLTAHLAREELKALL